jgi:hypothetical protein
VNISFLLHIGADEVNGFHTVSRELKWSADISFISIIMRQRFRNMSFLELEFLQRTFHKRDARYFVREIFRIVAPSWDYQLENAIYVPCFLAFLYSV